MIRHYATLFDQNYAAKGLALYSSLVRHSSEPFTLHILALDMETFWLFSDMKLAHAEIVPLNAFEIAMKMKPVRESRSWTEYCWTSASSFMEYLQPLYDEVMYLDADVFFFSDPKIIFYEIGEKSIGIVPHRFNESERRRLGANGEFNVGVIYAKNNAPGRHCIQRWAEQTREWCFARNENAKFGDQAYLDPWPQEYGKEVCVIGNLGVNLGPWSIANFKVFEHEGRVFVDEWPLVCFHFHEFRDAKQLTNWKLRDSDRRLIYEPYIREFEEAQQYIRAKQQQRESRLEPTIG